MKNDSVIKCKHCGNVQLKQTKQKKCNACGKLLRSKYNSSKIIIDNIKFDSKREAVRYKELKILEQKGLVKDLELQKRFILQDKYQNGTGKKIRKLEYICDFYYFDVKNGKWIIEDVKGYKTEIYKLKKKLFEHQFYPLVITEI